MAVTVAPVDDDGEDGAQSGQNGTTHDVMQVTPDHPLYVEDKGWLLAENLALGDRLRRADVAGQRLAGDGTLLDSELLIGDSSGVLYRDGPSDVVYNSAGGKFLVLWETTDVWARHVPVTGTMDSPVQVTSGDGRESGARAAYNAANDQYLLVWEQFNPATGQYDVLGRRMTGSGVVTSTETINIATGAPAQRAPDVAYLAGAGRYAVVWQDARNTGTSGTDIYGQLVTPAGALDGGNFQIAGADQDETAPRLDTDGEGGALILWVRDNGAGTGKDLYGRRLDSAGQLLGGTIIVLETAGNQDQAALAGDGGDRFFLAWRDSRNGGADIYGSLFEYLAAGFMATPRNGLAPLQVQFTDESTPAGAAGAWSWDFGDGGTSTVQHPVYTYTVPGAYTVTLTITDTDSGESDTLLQTNYITVSASVTLTANFTATPTSGTAPLAVQFTDESTPAGAADAWSWDFGDGGTSTVQHPVYTYTVPGTYSVTLTVTDTETSQTDSLLRPAYIQVDAGTVVTQTTAVIHYAYDDLYRLTGADYTGDITATYAYGYDAVGNMTTFTETVDAQTTRVTRSFDAANRLQSSNDGSGNTTYGYDTNGNLLSISPPSGGVAAYGYDQRNLLITSSLAGQPVARFVYDGDGNRLQQVDYTGSSAITTTYTNDIFGLAQVLVADDGTEQVYNLFGLDLISQDSGGEERTLLVDGLGSVRLEMVGALVETATTYEPYGQVLAQSGESGTVYGFTGEQEDNTTGLLYLRARYYHASLKVFMARDPWAGDPLRPQSLNGWSYGENNPFNRVDPSGRQPCSPNRSCGPDITDWLMQEMQQHFEYGTRIKALEALMVLRASVVIPGYPLVPTNILFNIATETPFKELVREWKFGIPRTPMQTPIPIGVTPVNGHTAQSVIGALSLLEYAHYGLAVDYANVTYNLPGGQCGSCSVVNPEDLKQHATATLCGNCIDSSDIGNMMFGLGGNARGYNLGETYGSAGTYNVLADWLPNWREASFTQAFLATDGRGAIPGWLVGATRAFQNPGAFCTIINGVRPIGYNDNAADVAGCETCVGEASAPRTANPDSLVRISNRSSTIEALKGLLGMP